MYLGDICALAGDGERHKTATGTDDEGSAVSRLWRRLENSQGRLGNVGDDFCLPELREVLFLGIVLWRGPGRRAGIERNDVLGGGQSGHERDQAKGSNEGCFHGRVV
jgi:hypothetical protein